jgi:hypothetical protein
MNSLAPKLETLYNRILFLLRPDSISFRSYVIESVRNAVSCNNRLNSKRNFANLKANIFIKVQLFQDIRIFLKGNAASAN